MKRPNATALLFVIGSAMAVKDWNDIFQYAPIAYAHYNIGYWYDDYEDYYMICHECVRGGGTFWQHPNFPPFITMYTNLDQEEDLLFTDASTSNDDDLTRCYSPNHDKWSYSDGRFDSDDLDFNPFFWRSSDWNSVNIGMAACA